MRVRTCINIITVLQKMCSAPWLFVRFKAANCTKMTTLHLHQAQKSDTGEMRDGKRRRVGLDDRRSDKQVVEVQREYTR